MPAARNYRGVVLHKGAVTPDQEAKLSQADLWGADLSQANLQGTNIQGANLIGGPNPTLKPRAANCLQHFIKQRVVA